MVLIIKKEKKNYGYSIDLDTIKETDSCETNYEMPLIILNGSIVEEVEVNSAYVDKGVIAKDKNGNDVDYYCLPDHVAIKDGSFEVCYSYIPTDKDFFDDLDFCGTKASDRVFAYGTAAEYCLVTGNYDEALMWERRYKDALMVATRKATSVILPRRRWV